ncbi:MAG: PQQ-binding-like beta-propeller repeat protein [Gemmataceae bacterium]
MRPRLTVLILLITTTLLAAASSDWPQWRGPNRTGLSSETGLLTTWPEGGPKLAWKVTGLGSGYSTVSIANDRIYLLGAKGRTEYLRCLNLQDGKTLWSTEVGAERGSYPGPRSTPTVDGDRVLALSSDGKVTCVSADKGTVLWKRDLQADFAGRHGKWAYAESPLVDGNRVICTPGGEAAALVCLDRANGKEIWRTAVRGLKVKPRESKGKMRGPGTYGEAGYASAVVGEFQGVKQYVQFLAGGVVGVDAANGKLLWHYDAPGTGSNANCSTPIVAEDSVFAAASYNVGGGRAKITRAGDAWKAEQVYFADEMQNHHGGMVLVNGHVYGTTRGTLVCLDFKTGKVRWSARSAGKGAVTYADGHLIVRGEDGVVCLVEANPQEYKEKGRFKQPDRSRERAWAHPVVAGGKLYLRDQDVLLCYDLRTR